MADEARDKAAAALKSVGKKLQARQLTEEELLAAAAGTRVIAPLLGVTPDELYELAVRGFTVLQAGYFQEAESIFDMLCFLDGSQSYFRNALGVAFLAQEKLDPAESRFRQAIKLNDKEPSYYVNLGETLLKKGLVADGIQLFEEADRLDPERKDFFVNRARQVLEHVKAQGGVEALLKQYDEWKGTQAAANPPNPEESEVVKADPNPENTEEAQTSVDTAGSATQKRSRTKRRSKR